MSADDHYDDGFDDPEGADGHGGGVHGLLATAFADDMPVLNLVPTAVDGYHRQRRRARVLGTAGGALALAGVIAAGTAMASGSWSRSTTSSTANGSGGSGGSAASIAKLCQGIYHRFSTQPGDHTYSADNTSLSRVCARDITALRAAIPGATVLPQRETMAQARTNLDVGPAERLPPGADTTTPLVQSGEYLVKVGGQNTLLSLFFSDRMSWGFSGCETNACPPNTNLEDGTPATESTAPAEAGMGALSVQHDARHWVLAMASIPNSNSQPLPYDFGKLVRSKAFAGMIAADTQDLNRLD
jgi:hypothetical protein